MWLFFRIFVIFVFSKFPYTILQTLYVPFYVFLDMKLRIFLTLAPVVKTMKFDKIVKQVFDLFLSNGMCAQSRNAEKNKIVQVDRHRNNIE